MLRPAHKPIETAPRDGTIIIVYHEDCGEFVVQWGHIQKNELFAPGTTGMWVSPQGDFTWQEADGNGPSHWRIY